MFLVPGLLYSCRPRGAPPIVLEKIPTLKHCKHNASCAHRIVTDHLSCGGHCAAPGNAAGNKRV